jgi:hypothetical protein
MELGEKWPVSFACDSDFHINCRGLFTCHISAIWDRWLYFPSEGRHAVDFFAGKIQRRRSGSNPQSWVPEASMLTTRPLESLRQMSTSAPLWELKLDIIMANVWLHRHFLNRRLGGPRSGVDIFWEKKTVLPCQDSNPSLTSPSSGHYSDWAILADWGSMSPLYIKRNWCNFIIAC